MQVSSKDNVGDKITQNRKNRTDTEFLILILCGSAQSFLKKNSVKYKPNKIGSLDSAYVGMT